MKRYITNNKLYNSKKVKVECGFEHELKKKCSSNIFNFDRVSKRIENMEENNLEKLNIFNLEENGKRRKIKILNIYNELKNNTHLNDDLVQNAGKNLVESKNMPIDKSMKNSKSNYTKYKNNDASEKLNKDASIQKIENYKKKKGNNQNKYYEKINIFLKEIHLSKISRKK